jgi:hypothetical protein
MGPVSLKSSYDGLTTILQEIRQKRAKPLFALVTDYIDNDILKEVFDWRKELREAGQGNSLDVLIHSQGGQLTARRLVAKAEFQFGELFPRVGFIVTNLETDSRAVVRFYNKRGTTEQWIKEGKQAVKMTRLSCHRFRSNEVRLWLSVMAYNLGNLWRRLVLPRRIDNWSLDEFAAEAGQNQRPLDQARAVLLAAASGKPSDAAAVRGDRAKDCRFTGGDGLDGGCLYENPSRRR